MDRNCLSASLSELFSSIQGEGPYVGFRQIFVRFAACNLDCQYCDTPRDEKFKATVPELIERIAALDKPKGITHSVSLTGGEPLLQVDFLKEFLPELKKEVKLPIYLETNGTLPDHLKEVLDFVDIIAMDIKLSGATGLSPFWREHRRFLELALGKDLFVKIVFTGETKIMELDEAVSLIGAVDADIPLVLQPVTPHGPIKHRPHAEQILAFQTLAARKLKNVRVIPQVHKLLGLS